MPPPCTVCGTSGPTFACSRCLLEFYCGTACQRLAWNGRAGVPAHKRLCQPCLVTTIGPVPIPQSDQLPIIQAMAESGAVGAMQATMQAADASFACIGDGGITLHAKGSAEELAFLLERRDETASAFNLGNRYSAGLGVARDPSAAFAYFLQAAQGGLAKAEYAVACMLSNADGVPKDALASKRWMLKAAKHGVADAQGACAVAFWDGSEGFPKDSAQALQWAQAAAQQGDKLGQLVMAELALEACDNVGAVPWLQRASAQGTPRAQMLLGQALFYGFGCSVDVAAGLEWLRKARAAYGTELDESAEQALKLSQTPDLCLVKLQNAMELLAANRKGKV